MVMYDSIRAYTDEDVTLWVLCLDEQAYISLNTMALPGIRPIQLATLEAADQDLFAVKDTRKLIEYYFTISPCFPLYLLQTYPEIDVVNYVDSDLYFYSDPKPIYDELGDKSVLIIPHRFADDGLWREKYGVYNVGLLSFRNDADGRACLGWWRERCLEWCKDTLDEENGRFADQKYLDHFPKLFNNVVVSQHKGTNLAPWNFMRFDITKNAQGEIIVDDQPLIFYHFQGLRLHNRWLYFPNSNSFSEMSSALFKWLYPPYVAALHAKQDEIKRKYPNLPIGVGHAREGGLPFKAILKGLKNGTVRSYLRVDFKFRNITIG